jgi:hypothetical protein
MPFRIIADSLTDLPEGLRDAAKQNGDKFVVEALKEGWGVEDVGGLKRALTEARSERTRPRPQSRPTTASTRPRPPRRARRWRSSRPASSRAARRSTTTRPP